jgi:hypothetical protein
MPTPAVQQDFVMYGARAALDGGVLHIERQIIAIERAVYDEPGLAFDLAKTLIESVCKTILTARNVSFGGTDPLPTLFKNATQCLPFLPVGSEPSAPDGTNIRDSLQKTMSGLNQTLLGVCELRNSLGLVSHGKAGPVPEMASVQAMLAAQAADAIVGFLHRVHKQDGLTRAEARSIYEVNTEFNAAVDERNSPVFLWFGAGDETYSLDYDASRLLFDSDLEAYRNELENFKASASATQQNSEEAADEPE